MVEDPRELEHARDPARVVVRTRRILSGVVVRTQHDHLVRVARSTGQRRFDIAIAATQGEELLRVDRVPEILQAAFDVR